jgi:hypothetical protein
MEIYDTESRKAIESCSGFCPFTHGIPAVPERYQHKLNKRRLTNKFQCELHINQNGTFPTKVDDAQTEHTFSCRDEKYKNANVNF